MRFNYNRLNLKELQTQAYKYQYIQFKLLRHRPDAS